MVSKSRAVAAAPPGPSPPFQVVRSRGCSYRHSSRLDWERDRARESAAASYATEDGRERQRINAARQHARRQERRAARTMAELRA